MIVPPVMQCLSLYSNIISSSSSSGYYQCRWQLLTTDCVMYKTMDTTRIVYRPPVYCVQWRRTVVKSGGRGQSGQAIKLFQITPYVSDF